MNSDPNKCKIFIGGLESSIDTPDLKKYFMAYGNVKDAIVCMDKHLRTSRGFGFITFATEEERQLTLEAQPIYIKDKRVEIKLALPKEEGVEKVEQNKVKAYKSRSGDLKSSSSYYSLRSTQLANSWVTFLSSNGAQSTPGPGEYIEDR